MNPGEAFEIRIGRGRRARSYRLSLGFCPDDSCQEPPSLGDELGTIDLPGDCPCGATPVVVGLSCALGRFVPANSPVPGGSLYVYVCTQRGTHCPTLRLETQAQEGPFCAHKNQMHLVAIPVA